MQHLGPRFLKFAIASSQRSSLPFAPLFSSHCLPQHALRSPVQWKRFYVAHEEPSEPDSSGKETPAPDEVRDEESRSISPFYFETGYALFAKRPSRPFPPPFISMPSSSFSDPLSTHNRAKNKKQPEFEGEMIRGVTNGDDAVLVHSRLIAANDGVGAWAQKERGHAA